MKKLDILGDNAVSVCCSPDLCMPPHAVVGAPGARCGPATAALPSHTFLVAGAAWDGRQAFGRNSVPFSCCSCAGVGGDRHPHGGLGPPLGEGGRPTLSSLAEILPATCSQFPNASQSLTLPTLSGMGAGDTPDLGVSLSWLGG